MNILVLIVLLVLGGFLARFGSRLFDWCVPLPFNYRLSAWLSWTAMHLAADEASRDEAREIYALVVSEEGLDAVSNPLAAVAPVATRSLASLARLRAWPVGERIVAVLALFLVLPVLAVIALAVKLSSRGPVLLKSHYVSNGEVTGALWIFRTFDCRSLGTAGVVPPTRFGRFLNRTELASLPGLVSVVMGDARLVGPRGVAPTDEAG